MPHRRTIVPAILVILLASACAGAQERLSLEQTRGDFDIFVSALHEAHPGFSRYTSRDEMAALEDAGRSRLVDGMSRQDLFLALYPLYAAVRDGHTKFYPQEKEGSWVTFHADQLLPFILHIDGSRAWVLEDVTGTVPPGTEVLSVNGMAMETLVQRLLPVAVFADGRGDERNALELGRHFASYYATFIGSTPAYSVVVQSPAGAGRQPAAAAVPAVAEDRLAAARSLVDRPDPLEFLVTPDGTAVLRIGLFDRAGLPVSFPEFLARSFSRIRSEGITRLVIDLRDNEGGTDEYGALLFSYIARAPFTAYDRIEVSATGTYTAARSMKLPWYHPLYRLLVRSTPSATVWTHHRSLRPRTPQGNAFTGSVVVIENGRSFSVTAEFLATVRSQHRGTIVGTESGGAYGGNTSGLFWIITTLPASRLTLGIPTWGYYMNVTDVQPLDRGIIPDIRALPSIEDILAGKDSVLEVALEAARASG